VHRLPLLSRLMRSDATPVNSIRLEPCSGRWRGYLPDSWFMKYPLIAFVLALGFQVIGQVCRDTALYALPVTTGKRGRPAK